MKANELMAYFENYYGEKYTGVFQEAMFDYLGDCSDEFLKAVGKVIILRYSRSFNKVPDPAIIEKNLEEIYKVMTDFQIKNALPEPPEEKCSYEEAEEYMQKIRDMFKTSSRGGLGRSFEQVFNDFNRSEVCQHA